MARSFFREYNFTDRRFYYENYFLRSILGDPGAASKDDAIFSGESLFQAQKSPLTLTEPVPEIWLYQLS